MTDSRDNLKTPAPITNSRLMLLKAAIRIFAEKGFEGASIREIADAAGVNSSLISFHFGGKAGLHAASLHLASRMAIHTAKTLPMPPLPVGPFAGKSAVLRQAVTALRAYIREFIRMSLRQKSNLPPDKEPELERAVLVLIAKSMIYPPEESMGSLMEAIQPHIEYLNRCLRVLRSDLDHDGLVRMGMSIHAQLVFFLCHQDILARLLNEPPSDEDDVPRLVTHFLRFNLNGLGIPDYYLEPESQ
ncbi:TetR/AcrR family transcriptional regulator [Geothrix sp. SG200]|uniref:TetR/AcrR family transcriptional regulator n=1 Tax=Geothrix sp. SG200 TaxID=2922865 RepID=UPI001FAB9BB2|nr:TetR/AcrR family transcriptional regulator [Geothrix sp. SG200]